MGLFTPQEKKQSVIAKYFQQAPFSNLPAKSNELVTFM